MEINNNKEDLQYSDPNSKVTDQFPCNGCGANLTYKPGTDSLTCEFCGAKNEIPKIDGEVSEQNFDEFIAKETENAPVLKVSSVNCHNCGATTTVDPKLQSADCPYCDTPLVLSNKKEENLIRPGGIIPFKINKNQTLEIFKKWLGGLWFAPNSLKNAINTVDKFSAMFIPFWTFDADCKCPYAGMRGDHYYVTEYYTTTENGNTVQRSRQVQKTRWTPVSGTVTHFLDDVLVQASKSLNEKKVDQLGPWETNKSEVFNEAYLAGVITERYQINLKDAFNIGKVKMDDITRDVIRRDIGGDVQKILQMRPNYKDITFKHILLPIYISAYRHNNKLYNVYVNGVSGKLIGDRPYSWIKITLLVIAILAVIGIILAVTR